MASSRGTVSFIWTTAVSGTCFQHFGIMPHQGLHLCLRPDHHGEIVGRLEGEPLYHASLDGAEYRQLLEEQGFAVVDHRADDQSCFGRTVWLAQLR